MHEEAENAEKLIELTGCIPEADPSIWLHVPVTVDESFEEPARALVQPRRQAACFGNTGEMMEEPAIGAARYPDCDTYRAEKPQWRCKNSRQCGNH